MHIFKALQENSKLNMCILAKIKYNQVLIQYVILALLEV